MDNKELYNKFCVIGVAIAILYVSGLDKTDLLNDVQNSASSFPYATVTGGGTGGISGETLVFTNPTISEMRQYYPKEDIDSCVKFICND